MSAVICLAGEIGSGKTSVGKLITANTAIPLISFGSYVREQVQKNGGDPGDRPSLQAYGERRIQEGVERFCRDVLKFGGYKHGESAVIDGVRHLEVLNLLRDIVAPFPLHLLFLEAGRERRSARSSDAARFDVHPVEMQIRSLQNHADVVIDAELDLDMVMGLVRQAVGEWGFPLRARA
jgi:hypothetical protein